MDESHHFDVILNLFYILFFLLATNNKQQNGENYHGIHVLMLT